MAKAFASQGDMTEKKISFTEVGDGLWAFTAEGDPNSGVIIGEESVMIVEAQATPRLANKVIEKVREVTDKPISHVVLTHYHAVRVLGGQRRELGEQRREMGVVGVPLVSHATSQGPETRVPESGLEPPGKLPAAAEGKTPALVGS